MTRSYLLDELDKTIALVGAIFSSVLTIWLKFVMGNLMYALVGILCFIVFTGYWIIRKFFHPSLIPSLDELKGSTRFYIALNIIFFLFLSYSIISIYLRPDPYIRPIGYFISTALMATIVANEILFLSPQKLKIFFTLCKIIIIGMSLEYSQILIFPSIVGIDPWGHQQFTLNILDNSYIPTGYQYSKLPLMHLMIGMTSLVTDLGYKMATMVSISSLQIICDTLFIFLLSKFLISTKVGLLAALLLEVANLHIRYGYGAIPNTVATIFILPIIYILFKIRKNNQFIGTSVVMFIMGALILTHTVASLCLAILLFVFWLSFEIYTRLFQRETDQSIIWTICIFFSTTMLAYWSYISGHIITLANIIKFGFRNPFPWGGYQYLIDIPLWEQIFTYIGIFLYFSISFIGCLYMMSKQFRNSNRFAITIGSIVILCLGFFPIIIGRKIIMGRWLYFSQILMAIPLSLSLFLLVEIFRHKRIKCILMSLLVFVLSFLLIISSITNIDNRLLSPNSGVRYAFFDSELQAKDTIYKSYNGKIGVDYYYGVLFLDIDSVYIDNLLEYGDFRNLQDVLIIVREEILNQHVLSPSRGICKIKYNPLLALDEQKFSNIYDCGSANGYLRP